MCSVANKQKVFDARAELIIPPFYSSNIGQTIDKQVKNVTVVVKVMNLLAGVCRRCQPDLGLPLLLSGGVPGFDHQRRCLQR